ncbi:predicted protein [Plenodomus lingam JN3]|uniref:Predicted protein n=1 Tax=Leptosphaeria maculans (strain JN3 / isolate v23.1.3 / race Av1-4-5-6-7-8) TaxID=985895 RepID=E4ZJT4_LEPMJ|nr:predicted protein [Plenodomus lingam JN3]CBX91369.1 predicted protein [Plenodomus lingam JN3]
MPKTGPSSIGLRHRWSTRTYDKVDRDSILISEGSFREGLTGKDCNLIGSFRRLKFTERFNKSSGI